MANYQAEIIIAPKEGVLDTQGKAVEKTLKNHGHAELGEVRVGRFVRLDLTAASEEEARGKVADMCRDVLVNDLIESCRVSLNPKGLEN